MKKFTSLLLAVVMVLTMALSAVMFASAEDAPLLENATVADFGTVTADDGTSSDTSYVSRTSTSGWKAEWAAYITGKDFNAKTPMIVINGRTSKQGSLTSPVITGGIDQLAFNYAFPFTDTQFALNITVYKADGTTVIKTLDKIEKTGLAKETIYNITLDIDVAEDCVIEIKNALLTGTDQNKDRLGIWNICWTAPAAVETGATTTEGGATTTEPGSSSTTGDNSVFFAAAAVAVVVLAGTAVVAKKRED